MNTQSTRPAEFDYRRPESRQNGNGSPPPDDPWTIPAPVEEAPPGDDILLLRQLLAAQKENVLWSQRAAVIVRDLRDVPFWWLVKLFVKAAFAVIPAAIIIAVIWAIVNAIIAGTIAAVLGLLLVGGSRADDARPTAAPRPAVVAPVRQPVQEVVPTSAPIADAPIAAPLLTLDETEQIRVIAQREYSTTFKSLDVSGRTVTVNLEKANGPRLQMMAFLVTLQSVIPKFFVGPPIDELRIVFTCEIQNGYGNPEMIQCARLVFPATLYKKINWPNLTDKQFAAILDEHADGARLDIDPTIKSSIGA